jgi:tRNA threonylcarbamoyladenosine biosynthesis protein TsaE
MKIYTLKLNEMDEILDEIIEKFPSGIVILRGNLASGKTTFVKKIVKKIGVCDDVTSPTFSLQQCYGDNIFHYDIYNHGVDHFVSLGMLEELDKDGLHFIEWGDQNLIDILKASGMKVLVIDINKISDEMREYRVEYNA